VVAVAEDKLMEDSKREKRGSGMSSKEMRAKNRTKNWTKN